jgi:hypothetical protein
MTKVIYRDGTIGIVNASAIDKLRNEGKLYAYNVYHGWVKVRRKHPSDQNYKGPERRVTALFV